MAKNEIKETLPIFNSGDVVILKSGGRPMTVSECKHYQDESGTIYCQCIFMSISERAGDQVETILVPEHVLILASEHKMHTQLQATRLLEAELREVELKGAEAQLKAKAAGIQAPPNHRRRN